MDTAEIAMKHALIVDDSAVVRKIAKRIMTNMNFRTTEADGGDTALAACNEEMPDVVLLDWNMPRMDGMEFLTKLRTMDRGTEPKVIFCTTENRMESIESAILAGADEYVMKPFDEMILKSKLEQVGLV